MKNDKPYKFLKEITMGERYFNSLELDNYHVLVVPNRYGNMIKKIIPGVSLVTCNQSIEYKIILKLDDDDPFWSISATVRCKAIYAKASFSPDYFKKDIYYMKIVFPEIGLYDVLIKVDGSPQILFNVLYTNNF